MKEYFVFDRVSGRGNSWANASRRRFRDRSDANNTVRYLKRVDGRDVRLVHIEPRTWTPQAIAGLQARGILPR